MARNDDPWSSRDILLVDAARQGDRQLVAELLDEGEANPKWRDSLALLEAATNGHIECAKLLIPHCSAKAHDSEPLRWAAFNGDIDMVKLLLPVSNPEARDSSALLNAAGNNHLECVRELLPLSDVGTVINRCIAWGDTDVADVIREQVAFLQKEQMHAELGESLGRASDAPRKARRM